MRTKPNSSAPLLCWDFYAMYLSDLAEKFNRETEIALLMDFKEKFGWTLDVEKIIDSSEFEALVLTDKDQKIIWVNKGFTKMTGYPMNFAIGKKPNFLQGEESLEATRKVIKKHLKTEKHFKEQIVNYKKDGKPYNCEIEIFPLKDGSNKTTHLLALENSIDM
jgi:PAS domain S-box-containing protein